MEKKKSNRANLENKKGIFLQIGFIVALATVLLAFEWKTSDRADRVLATYYGEDVELLLPVNTIQPKPLPPPPAQKPVITIKEIPNDAPDPPNDFRIDIDIRPDDPNPDIFILPDEPEDSLENKVFIVVEKDPQFPGGEAAMYRFLKDNLHYPESAKSLGISGPVYVGFVVEKDGSLTDITIRRSPHDLLSTEAIRVVSAMPPWEPGRQREKPVRVAFTLPIRFVLQ